MDLAFLVLLGRVLVGGAFVISGARMLQSVAMVSGLLESKRVPYPTFFAAAGAVFEVIVGAIVIAGFWLPVAFAALAIFVVAATIMVHNFWAEAGAQRGGDINTVISNVIIVGALLALAGLSA